MKAISVSAAVLFAISSVSAQNADLAVGKDIKDLKQQETSVRKEKKEERKALRKLEGQDVSYQSKQQFYSDFGNLPVTKWTRSDYFDEASFVKDGVPMIAYYDENNELVGTTEDKTFDDLPAVAQRFITAHYPGYTMGPVIFFDDNETNDMDMVMYGTQFDDSDMYFIELSKNGKKIILEVDLGGSVSFFTQVS